MYRSAREHPSFSSSLLDAIYRSFDERDDRKSASYRETTRPKQSSSYYQHDMIENWKVKEATNHSSSSSSDSSSGGGFSSSETESVYYKPIRTNKNRHDVHNSKQMNAYQQQQQQPPEQQQQQQQRYRLNDTQPKQKQEGKLVKTKSRAMKIYGDLKKAKQPISPGGKLATFLNSIFTSSNTKSTKHSSGSIESKSATASTCSSASSFSRSCLSKTPSSRGKLSNNKKRSVRFYPVSVIVGDDCQPCGHKSLYGDESSLHALKFVKKTNDDEPRVYSNEKARRIEEAARNLLRNYQKKVDLNQLVTGNVTSNVKVDLSYEDDEDEDEDDVASNASSDLFELENFSAIGMENYGDELPVYETTRLDTCSLR